MMETAWLARAANSVAAYGILGMGWLLYFFSLFYIRVERRRYQDLVLHIIAYFTKIHMAEGHEDVVSPIVAGLIDKRFGARRRKSGSDIDSTGLPPS